MQQNLSSEDTSKLKPECNKEENENQEEEENNENKEKGDSIKSKAKNLMSGSYDKGKKKMVRC